MKTQIMTGLSVFACVFVASHAYILPFPPMGPIVRPPILPPMIPPMVPPMIPPMAPCGFGSVRVPSFRGFVCQPSIAYGGGYGGGMGAGMGARGGYGGYYGGRGDIQGPRDE